MKHALIISTISAALMIPAGFAQESTQSTTATTTTTKHHGKKSKTETMSATQNSDAMGTSSDMSTSKTKAKRKHGKTTEKTITHDSSSVQP